MDNIGQDDFETAEVKHPVTGQWIALTPVVEGSGLKLVVGPTSNYAVGPDDIVTLTFRVEFNTAGDYEATGILYCHDSGSAVEIGRLTDTMVVLPPPNVAPVAVDDDYTTLEDTLLSVDTPGILANDTDANGDDLIAILETNVSHGTLTLNENGSFSYMPDENWNGVDSFTYKVNDGELDSNVATVTITVSSVNDAPVAEDIDVTTPEDTAIGITLLGSDVEGDTLTYEIVSEPTNGTIILVDNVATYNPNENWYGVDTFTYKANDGELDSNVATVTITVTPVKDQVRAVDDEYEVDQGQTLTVPAPGVLANDIDPDNNEWVATLKTNVAHGVLVLNQDGGFVYTPDSDFRGTDSFVYTLVTYPATQSLWTDDATVTITVNPVYGMPTISSDDIEGPYTVGELREFNVTLTNPADGASYTSLSASIFVDNIGFDDYDTVEVKHPVYGTWVALTPVVDGSGLRLDVGPTSNYPVGPGDVITLTFRVNFNTPGTYPAEGTLYDTAGATPVEIASFNATLTVNHADTLDEQIKEAVNYEYDPVYEYTGDMTFDVTSNTYTMIYWPAEYLDGAPMRDLARYLGALHYQDISTVESLTYKGVVYTWNPGNPPLVGSNWKDANGVSLVSVIVAELLGQYPGTATVTLADSLYTADVSFVVDVYNTLDAEIASAPTYVYDPVYHYVGSFVFDDASNTYTVTYTDDNVAPGAMNDLARYLGALYRQAGSTVIKVTYKGVDYTWNPAEPLKGSNWEDADGTTLVSVVTADFLGGMIDPATGVTFTLSDGIHTETVTFIIVINDTTAPEVVSITAIGAEGFADVEAVGGVITVDQGYIVDHTVIVLDEDVTVEAGTVVSIGGQPYGSITAEGSVLTVVPFGSNGIASLPGTFELSIPDGSVKDLAGNALQDLVVTLVVNNVAPVANDDAYITEEDIELVVPAPGILANDVDWTPITVALVGDVSNGTLTLNANGSFSYLPDEDWHGEDSFTYKVSDGELESNTATVTITVTPVKDQVRAVDDEYETDEDVVLTVSAEDGVLSNDIDPDGNERRAVLKTDVQHGQLTLNSDGSFEYIPDADWFGEDSFIYELVTFPRTQSLWTDTATVTITVHPVNDAPVLDEIPDTTIPEMAL
ncbi:MAG: Ig-like domain-containing protein, partial [Oscillospiraceae bacterium]